MMPYPYPVVPETITVHLGAPGESARNVVVPFAQYIKNVASHEIYPTWPESAIRANILAQISYALNRTVRTSMPLSPSRSSSAYRRCTSGMVSPSLLSSDSCLTPL